MFLLNDKPLSPDVAFTDINGIQRPANWLRLSSPEERTAAGITEVPNPPTWDQRFYWGYDADGQLIPKDHGELVTLWTANTRTTANTLLTPSDWMVIREADNSTVMDPDWKMWRESIRLAADEKVVYIGTTNDTADLAAYITGADYSAWPNDPDTPVADSSDDGLQLVGDQPAQ